jgi:ATP-dependent protease ClpP protease subunit
MADVQAITDLLFSPSLSINGLITADTVTFVLDRLQQVRSENSPLRVELNTQGGDADAARRIALELQLFQHHAGRPSACVGKTNVYSAGILILAAFPKEARYLTRDTILLVHQRRLETTLQLNGPINRAGAIGTPEDRRELEQEGFAQFAKGSSLSVEELTRRAKTNCYLTAAERWSSALSPKSLDEVRVRSSEGDGRLSDEWLTEKITSQSLEEGTISVFDLATACRIQRANEVTPHMSWSASSEL